MCVIIKITTSLIQVPRNSDVRPVRGLGFKTSRPSTTTSYEGREINHGDSVSKPVSFWQRHLLIDGGRLLKLPQDQELWQKQQHHQGDQPGHFRSGLIPSGTLNTAGTRANQK